VIETREVARLGSVRPHRIDVRFIAATNRDLEAEVARGAFRADLYYRLNGITLTIPPLRVRLEEIRPLAETFARQICRDLGRPPPLLPPASVAHLEAYGWPGNIRELKNVIERAVLLSEGQVLEPEHLPLERPLTESQKMTTSAAGPARSERDRIVEALAACAGNQSRAAKMLGIARRTFVTKLDAYKIPRPKKGA
jgi:DNA-binding NtrC family response regulator